jgi:hypothetical protein
MQGILSFDPKNVSLMHLFSKDLTFERLFSSLRGLRELIASHLKGHLVEWK